MRFFTTYNLLIVGSAFRSASCIPLQVDLWTQDLYDPTLATVTSSITTTGLNTRQSATNGTDTMAPPYFVIYAAEGEGPPPVANLTGFNVVCLTFLYANGTTAEWSPAAAWQNLPASQRASVKAEYAAAGIKLFISAFGSSDTPTTEGADPTTTATTIANWAKQYDVDGVDVDYEDFGAITKGTAEPWIINFTTQLSKDLEGSYLISHTPIAGWFNATGPGLPGGGYRTVDKAVGSMINWYNVQFYNTPNLYTTCDHLLEASNGTWADSHLASQTSVFEIHEYAQIPLDKIVIGKPVTPNDAGGGYMNGTYLGTCIQQAKQNDWNAGIMLWQYSNVSSTVIQEARSLAFPL
ncbi:glycoside hydrolase family 18 protein [Mycena galericulata]|nr:glycoside hydrolase family 18 protein [Mycena galericulata]